MGYTLVEDKNPYGYRPDGTKKGRGFLGEIRTPKGDIMTEYSIGVNLDGKEVDIPTLVPTLTKQEIEFLKTQPSPNKIPKTIMDKAINHAVSRMRKGQSPFYTDEHKKKASGGYTLVDEGPLVRSGAGGRIEARNEQLKPGLTIREKIGQALKEPLQLAGAIGGAIFGAPAAPETLGASSVIGAGLGYAAGGQLAEGISGYKRPALQRVGKVASDIAEGATMEMGGAVLKPGFMAVKGGGKTLIKKMSGLTKKGLERKAGDMLVARLSTGDIYARNAAEAARLEKEIPGLRFTTAERTADPNMVRMERTAVRTPREGVTNAAEMKAEQISRNDQAIRDHYQRVIPGKKDAFLKRIGLRKEALEKASKEATETSKKELGKLPVGQKQDVGRRIKEQIETESEPVKRTMENLESMVPDYPMSFTNLRGQIQKELANKKNSISQIKALKTANSYIDELAKNGESTHTSFGINRTLNDMIESAFASGDKSTGAILTKIKKQGLEKDLQAVSDLARSGKIVDYQGKAINPDRIAMELEEKLKKIASFSVKGSTDEKTVVDALKQKGIPAMKQRGEGQDQYLARIEKDYKRVYGGEIPQNKLADKAELERLTSEADRLKTVLSEVSPGQDVAAHMKAYNDYASNEYFGRFAKGATKQATERAGMREENIPNLFKTPTGADELITAMGSREKAASIIRGDLNNDLYTFATDQYGNISTGKLKTWIARNKTILDKYGLQNEYNNLENAQMLSDTAESLAKDFQKTAAQKILDSDPEKAIEAALTGSNIGEKARQLVKEVKGDPAALRGLQNSLAEHLITISEISEEAIKSDPIRTADKINKTFRKYIPAIREIYKGEPQKIKALMDINKAVNVSARTLKAPIGSGSDTYENFANQLFKTMAPHGRTMQALNAILTPIRNRSEREIQNYINKALFDPEYAKTLIDAARGRLKPKEFETIFNRQLSALSQAPKILTQRKVDVNTQGVYEQEEGEPAE